ncbi:general odorant-binding protein 72 isoform X2 [Anopheles moucheti]|uniref:general odorant-binding protein 72 isoform X2 n=1 Tax=Anopheles moucheti TaxID=186751 RepID=UPI0022F128EB|nr:general odorant-binding protein 72 isoform X2 [Anopheles moucheti]
MSCAELKFVPFSLISYFYVHRNSIADNSVADDVNRGVFADTKDFKCYVSCLLDIMQVARKGKVNYEKSLKQIDTMLPDDMKPAFRAGLEACKTAAQGVKDHCEAASILLQCFYKNNPKFVFP